MEPYLLDPRLPSRCVCGEAFTVDPAPCCLHGGYLGIRLNEVGNLLGQLLDETCLNVSLERTLQPLTGEQLPSSYIEARPTKRLVWTPRLEGFGWPDDMSVHFFYLRVFHPYARSYRHRTIQQSFRTHEQESGELMRQDSGRSMVVLLRF